MKATIDRIEGSIAVLISRDDESVHLNLPVGILPAGSREGDIVTVSVERDDALTASAKGRVSSLIGRLQKK